MNNVTPLESTEGFNPGILQSVGLLWMSATLWYLLCEAASASAFPGYSYATFYISDLGVPEVASFQGRALNSPLFAVMNAGFIGAGLLFFLGMLLLAPTLPRRFSSGFMVFLSAIYALSISFVGLVPGSPTNVENGLMIFHVLGAVGAIFGGNLLAAVSVRALRIIGPLRWSGLGLGLLGLLCAWLLNRHVFFPDGVWERGSVYTFMLWQFLLGLLLWRHAAKAREPRSQHALPRQRSI